MATGAVLENYKAQSVSVERGFRFLKDPLFFARSLFLKSPAFAFFAFKEATPPAAQPPRDAGGSDPAAG